MPRLRATIAYDGTNFHGWQIQPSLPTVQSLLADSIRHITGEAVLPQGAGRTDTGVHALGQVAHFDLLTPIPPANLLRALNRSLPPAIRILTLTPAANDFHARHHARHKTYEYRILPRTTPGETICPPILAPYLWPVPRPLCLATLNQAAAQVIGTHNFTSFAAADPATAREALSSFREAGGPAFPDTPHTRTILASTWTLDSTHTPPILRYRVTGTGFLHHMVRNLVGTFVEYRRFPPSTIPQILAARNREAAGPTAPPHGLFLAEVVY